jgi:hypothetical protein
LIQPNEAGAASDVISQRGCYGLERVPGISQDLAGGARPTKLLSPQDEFRPEPREWDLLGIGTEFAEQERRPHRLERSRACHFAEPFEGADVVHPFPVASPRERKHGEAKAEAIDRWHGRVREKIPRRHKWPDPAVSEHPDGRPVPFELSGKKLIE